MANYLDNNGLATSDPIGGAPLGTAAAKDFGTSSGELVELLTTVGGVGFPSLSGYNLDFPPKSMTVTRDAGGAIETATVAGENTWTITRNANGTVASITDTVYLVTANRDGDGILTGVTATVI